MVKRIVKILK